VNAKFYWRQALTGSLLRVELSDWLKEMNTFSVHSADAILLYFWSDSGHLSTMFGQPHETHRKFACCSCQSGDR
jgi:hypothetical protein